MVNIMSGKMIDIMHFLFLSIPTASAFQLTSPKTQQSLEDKERAYIAARERIMGHAPEQRV